MFPFCHLSFLNSSLVSFWNIFLCIPFWCQICCHFLDILEDQIKLSWLCYEIPKWIPTPVEKFFAAIGFGIKSKPWLACEARTSINWQFADVHIPLFLTIGYPDLAQSQYSGQNQDQNQGFHFYLVFDLKPVALRWNKPGSWSDYMMSSFQQNSTKASS